MQHDFVGLGGFVTDGGRCVGIVAGLCSILKVIIYVLGKLDGGGDRGIGGPSENDVWQLGLCNCSQRKQ